MRYAFGPFELDTSTLELLRDGEPVSIEPQVFEVLVHLIENRDRVLSKDDLIDAVWGGRIVSDSAISTRIKMVRRAVDDDGSRQAVIKTVHGKGFRFIADLKDPPVVAPDPLPNSEPAPLEPPTPKPQTRLLAPIGLAAAAALGVLLLFQLFTGSARTSEARIAVLPISNQTGDASLDWIELGLMSLVSHELEARSELSVVPDGTIVKLSDRFSTPDNEALEPHEQMQRALQDGYGASHLLMARLTGSADALVLEYRVLNPRGLSAPTSVSAMAPADLAREMSRLVASTLPRSGQRPLQIEDDKFDDSYVAETYARGRDLQMQGKGAEAADLFRVAAAQVPNNLEVLYELAVSTRMAGDLDSAEAQFENVIAASVAAGDTLQHAMALNGIGVAQMTRREDALALETFTQALDLLSEAGNPETRAHVLTNIGIVERRLRNFEAAEDALGRAMIAYQAAGYELPPGHLLNSMANLKVQMRDIPTANQYYQQALEYHRLVGDRWAEAVNLHNLGTNAITQGDRARAKDLLNSALELRREMGDTRGQMTTLWSLARLAVNQGNVETADQYTEEMVTLAEEAGDQYLFAQAQESAAHMDMVRGEWAAALEHSQRAQAIYEDQSRPRKVHRERIRQAAINGFAGDTQGADTVEEVLDWALSENQRGTQLHAYEALTVLSLVDQDYQRAADHIDAAVALSSEMQLNSANGRLAARQGLVRLLLGDETGATASLGKAMIGNPEHQETVLLDGLLKLSRGDTGAGAARIAEAREISGDNWSLTQRLFWSLGEGI
nr:tetratricopeptide repeat protein [Hyphomonas sp. Mor2]